MGKPVTIQLNDKERYAALKLLKRARANIRAGKNMYICVALCDARLSYYHLDPHGNLVDKFTTAIDRIMQVKPNGDRTRNCGIASFENYYNRFYPGIKATRRRTRRLERVQWLDTFIAQLEAM